MIAKASCFRRADGVLIASALALALGWCQSAQAVTPESPEVKILLDKAFKFLETANDNRLGAKCLVGLCFVKRGENETYPQVKAAVDACKAAAAQGAAGRQQQEFVYSTGLAIVFLCELNPSKYQAEIHKLLEVARGRATPLWRLGLSLEQPHVFQNGRHVDDAIRRVGKLGGEAARLCHSDRFDRARVRMADAHPRPQRRLGLSGDRQCRTTQQRYQARQARQGGPPRAVGGGPRLDLYLRRSAGHLDDGQARRGRRQFAPRLEAGRGNQSAAKNR